MGTRATLYALVMIILLAAGCNHREVIVEGLTQEDANEILVALWDHYIDAKKLAHPNRKGTSYDIAVGAKQTHAALRILVVNHLPQTRRVGLKEVYPPGSAGLIPTKSDESARLVMALQGELEALIKALPRVADARVVLAMDQAPELGKTPNAKSASVTVSYRSETEFEDAPVTELELASLVSSAVGSMPAQNVRVIMKVIKPIKFLSGEDSSSVAALPPNPTTPPQSPLVWSLLLLVMVALLVAAYALLRPKFVRWARG